MDDSKENTTSKSSSQDEMHEHMEEKKQKSCIASSCVFARWSKPVNVLDLLFVSKDVLLIHVEKTLIFYNVKTHKEDLLVVGGNTSTPEGGAGLNLDGIGCVDCCGIDLLALAEQPPVAKVLVCRYPDLKVLATLIDGNSSAAYKSILFLRLEYLIGLRDHPEFDLIVWAWRIQEKLLVVNTGFIQPDQRLNVSVGGKDVYLSQTENDVKSKLQLWTLFIGCKSVYTERTVVRLPSDSIASGCWTPSGWFVFCDLSTDAVYRSQPGAPDPETCVEPTGNTGVGSRTLVCPTKQGFMLYTTDDLTCFKDNKGVFTQMWTIVVSHTLSSMVAGENDVYGWSDEGILLELTQKKEQTLRVYGSNIKYFAFIKPTDETVATVNENCILQVWHVSTGEFKSEIKLNGIATHLSSNPLYCYVAIAFENGKVELLRTDPKTNVLGHIAKLVLCDEVLSTVKFFFDGQRCVATSFPTGRFYYIGIELGKACSVEREYNLGKPVIGFEIFDDKKSSYLTILYKDWETVEVAGNNIIILDVQFNVIFEIKDTQFYYTSIFKWISFVEPNVINMGFTMVLSKRIHLMVVNVEQTIMLELKNISLDHDLRSAQVSSWENHCITFGHDGTYNLYESDGSGQWKKIVVVNCSHWQTGGLMAAQVDVNACNVLTLSHLGNFMCTSFKETCNHARQFLPIYTPIILNNMKTEGIGFEDVPGTSKRMTWTMINEKNELNASKIEYSKQKGQIIEEFEKIKKELLTLIEMNVNCPEETKINIEEFDLNIEYRIQFREKCKTERREFENHIFGEIEKFELETRDILKDHWESLFVKPKSIHCLKKLYIVDNYPISIVDQDIIDKANIVIEKRNMIKNDENHASHENRPFSKETILPDDIFRLSNDKSLTGSISHTFVNVTDYLNSQNNYFKLEMAKDEITLLKYTVNKLKHSFNGLFDKMFVEKQRQLDNLNGFNDRLRIIETEFRMACKIEPTEPSPVNYEWSQYEQTDRLTHVEDVEVSVRKYTEELSQKPNNVLIKIDLAEEEGYTQLMPSDGFRQKALIDMMDGVLEKRWEDELKKDVPKPQCMLKKKPEEYTEDDFKDIREFEDKTAARNNERIKYKKILEYEKIKIVQQIDDTIDEFDNNVFKLFQTKLKYNSAINHEYLKIIRLSKMLSDSEQRKQQIKQHKEKNLEIEKSINGMTKKIAKTEAMHNSLLNTIETLKHKNNVLNKRFKSDFPSKLIYEQALIAYNRRPKIQGNKNYSSLLGYQFVNTVMDPRDDKLDLLSSEFVKYLDTLRVYDDYKYVEDYKLNMDRDTWYKVCNFRRIKIESEFKISTYQKDAIDKANLLESLTHNKEEKEAMIEKIKTSITKLENQNSYYENDPEIQLVVKQGSIEIKLTGHFKDFDNTTLVAKNDIEQVNAEIKNMGAIKVDVLSSLLVFRRKCRFLKWEHVVLKNHILTLYKYRYDVITSMKVTENMLHYLKFKMKDINIAKQAEQKADKELAGFQITYLKKKKELTRHLDELVDRIKNVKIENKKTDKDIEKTNDCLSELKSKIDHGLTNKLKTFNDIRMKNIMKRAKIIAKIQELHREVFLLQTELELLLLKTFPTLYHTPSSSTSIRR